MNPQNETPQQPQTPPEQPNMQVPPAPGAYIPPEDVDPQSVPLQDPEVNRELPASNPSVVDEQIAHKKGQARKLILIATLCSALFLIGVGVIVAITLSSKDDVPSLSVEDQLKADANAFGLGVINYTKSQKEAFNIEPDQIGELRITYLPSNFMDPRTADNYTITTEIPLEGELQYVLGGVCNTDDSISQSGKSDNFAVRTLLENGTLFCVDRGEVTVPEIPQP